jgi:hypothetical protein
MKSISFIDWKVLPNCVDKQWWSVMALKNEDNNCPETVTMCLILPESNENSY